MPNGLNSISLEESRLAALRSRSVTEKTASSGRIPAFDFTKGALVLFMVLYHWLNYFVGATGDYYNYLHFLTPSFIFITGFLISHVHFAKYGMGSARLSARLLIRGLKLLALFIALNFLIAVCLPGSSVHNAFCDAPLGVNLYTIFVDGNSFIDGIGKAAAFGILVPIGYLLICSSGLLLLSRNLRYIFQIACGLLLMPLTFLAIRGIQVENLELLMIGLMGVALGYVSGKQIKAIVSHRFALCGVYCLYLAALTFWGVPLGLRIVGVLLTTTLIYMVGDKNGRPGFSHGQIVLLGQYSLFGYISQIAILQILRHVFSTINFGPGARILSLLLGFALTIASVQLMDALRARAKVLDAVYRAVFA